MKNKIPISVQSDSLHAFYSFYALKSVLCGFKIILHHLLIISHEYKLTIIYDYYLKYQNYWILRSCKIQNLVIVMITRVNLFQEV